MVSHSSDGPRMNTCKMQNKDANLYYAILYACNPLTSINIQEAQERCRFLFSFHSFILSFFFLVKNIQN